MKEFASFCTVASGRCGIEADENVPDLLSLLRRASGMIKIAPERTLCRISRLEKSHPECLWPQSHFIQATPPSEKIHVSQIYLGDLTKLDDRLRGGVIRKIFSLALMPLLQEANTFLLHGALATTENGNGILLCGPSGVGKSTACKKIKGTLPVLADDFLLLSRDKGCWFAQPAPTWSVWCSKKEEVVPTDINRIVPLRHIVLLGRDGAALEPLSAHETALGLSASFSDMILWQSRFIAGAELLRTLRLNAFTALNEIVNQLQHYRLRSELTTDITTFLSHLE